MKKFTLLLALAFSFNQIITAQDIWGTISGWIKPALTAASVSAVTYIVWDHFRYIKNLEKHARNQRNRIVYLNNELNAANQKNMANVIQIGMLNKKATDTRMNLFEVIRELQEANKKIKKIENESFQKNIDSGKQIVQRSKSFMAEILAKRAEK